MKKFLKRCLKRRDGLMPLMFVPSMAFARSTDQDMISTILEGGLNLLTSKPAVAMFLISIVWVGYQTFGTGKFPKERGLMIMVGIGIVFSATYIAKQIGVAV